MKAWQATATVRGYLRTRVRWRGLIPVVLFGLSILFTVHYYHDSQAAQQRQAAQQAAAQRQQAQAFEKRLCATLLPVEGLAQLKPPAGDPAANPSRAFEQELARKLAPLAELGPDVGCNGKR